MSETRKPTPPPSGEPEVTAVTFNQQWMSYFAGEVAAFTPEMAQKLMDEGIGTSGAETRSKPEDTPGRGPPDTPPGHDKPHAEQHHRR